jgi:hypothetical protein
VAEGRLYLLKTLRTFAVVTGFVAFLLYGYKQSALIPPFLGGAALGVVLLLTLEVTIRRIFAPLPKEKTAGENNKNDKNGEDFDRGKKKSHGMRQKTLFLLVALIKYPLVGILLWWIASHWKYVEVIAFAGGFVLLQMVIGLRALGRAIADNQNSR